MFRIASAGRASWGSRPGVRAGRLDELALRLGTDRVEHGRRVAASAHARDGDEPVLRHVDVDALEGCACGRLGSRWRSPAAVLKAVQGEEFYLWLLPGLSLENAARSSWSCAGTAVARATLGHSVA